MKGLEDTASTTHAPEHVLPLNDRLQIGQSQRDKRTLKNIRAETREKHESKDEATRQAGEA